MRRFVLGGRCGLPLRRRDRRPEPGRESLDGCFGTGQGSRQTRRQTRLSCFRARPARPSQTGSPKRVGCAASFRRESPLGTGRLPPGGAPVATRRLRAPQRGCRGGARRPAASRTGGNRPGRTCRRVLTRGSWCASGRSTRVRRIRAGRGVRRGGGSGNTLKPGRSSGCVQEATRDGAEEHRVVSGSYPNRCPVPPSGVDREAVRDDRCDPLEQAASEPWASGSCPVGCSGGPSWRQAGRDSCETVPSRRAIRAHRRVRLGERAIRAQQATGPARRHRARFRGAAPGEEAPEGRPTALRGRECSETPRSRREQRHGGSGEPVVRYRPPGRLRGAGQRHERRAHRG